MAGTGSTVSTLDCRTRSARFRDRPGGGGGVTELYTVLRDSFIMPPESARASVGLTCGSGPVCERSRATGAEAEPGMGMGAGFFGAACERGF